jgi:micrococcal nuclease
VNRIYQYAVKVNRVVDGDTFVGDVDMGMQVVLTGQRFRLKGVNAPEKSEKGFDEALDYLRESIADTTVLVISHGTDKYGRWLVDVYTEGVSDSLNDRMLQDGIVREWRD